MPLGTQRRDGHTGGGPVTNRGMKPVEFSERRLDKFVKTASATYNDCACAAVETTLLFAHAAILSKGARMDSGSGRHKIIGDEAWTKPGGRSARVESSGEGAAPTASGDSRVTLFPPWGPTSTRGSGMMAPPYRARGQAPGQYAFRRQGRRISVPTTMWSLRPR